MKLGGAGKERANFVVARGVLGISNFIRGMVGLVGSVFVQLQGW